MKKSIVLCAGLCVALAFTGCKSSESAYKKAYEKAKAQESVQTSAQTEAPVVAPLTPAPVTQTQVVDNVDNATVRTEDVTVVSGSGLSAFSVVVGSFGLKANAEGLQYVAVSRLWSTNRLQFSSQYVSRRGFNPCRQSFGCSIAQSVPFKVS